MQDIVSYIAKDSVANALQFYDDIILKIEKLYTNPYIYRKRVSINDENIRELIHKGYTVPYFIDESNSKIIVLGIFNRNIWN